MLTKKQIKRRLTYIIEHFKVEEVLEKLRSFKGVASAEGTRAWSKEGDDVFIYIVRNIKGERFSSMIVFSNSMAEKYSEIDDRLDFHERAIASDALYTTCYDAKLCEKYEMDNFLSKHFSDEKTK